MEDKNRQKFIDGLRRVKEMEESMTEVLIELCRPALMITDISSEALQEIREELLKIQSDTVRHKQIVMGLLRDNGETAGE